MASNRTIDGGRNLVRKYYFYWLRNNEKRWLNLNGLQPLTHCIYYITDLHAQTTLISKKRVTPVCLVRRRWNGIFLPALRDMVGYSNCHSAKSDENIYSSYIVFRQDFFVVASFFFVFGVLLCNDLCWIGLAKNTTASLGSYHSFVYSYTCQQSQSGFTPAYIHVKKTHLNMWNKIRFFYIYFSVGKWSHQLFILLNGIPYHWCWKSAKNWCMM